MEIDNKIIIKTLGNCSIACRDNNQRQRCLLKKFWTALGYLVINRYRPIPQSELVDILYPAMRATIRKRFKNPYSQDKAHLSSRMRRQQKADINVGAHINGAPTYPAKLTLNPSKTCATEPSIPLCPMKTN